MQDLVDKSESLLNKVREAPLEPGVYLMKDSNGKVIYVGKARSLRPRVRSYFQDSLNHSAKTQYMVQHIEDVEFITAGTEVEALLLENNLIKKWKPKYNIRLKDDKTYPYMKLDLRHSFPRPVVARRQVKEAQVEYFGPFPNGHALRQTLELGAKVFKLRDCRDHEFANRSRPCLSYQMQQCTAPCVAFVTQEQYAEQVSDFRDFVKSGSRDLTEKWREEMMAASEATQFELAAKLRDRIRAVEVITGQEQRMVDTEDHMDKDVWAMAPKNWDQLEKQSHLDLLILQFRGGLCVGRVYRNAEITEGIANESLGEQLLLQHYLKHVLPSQIVLPDEWTFGDLQELARALQSVAKSEEEPRIAASSQQGNWARLHELAQDNVNRMHEEQLRHLERNEEGLVAIAKLLELKGPPRRMECVDISNFQGEENVASAVVFMHGKPDKSEYRHYKISGFDGQNDFASMRELMARRYGKSDSPVPDLLVVDGGKGQLSSVMLVLNELGCKFPVVGLAKARTKRDFKSGEVEATEERLFLPGQKNELRIKNPQALRVLTQIRDEAHRFAIEFHRLRRGKARIKN